MWGTSVWGEIIHILLGFRKVEILSHSGELIIGVVAWFETE